MWFEAYFLQEIFFPFVIHIYRNITYLQNIHKHSQTAYAQESKSANRKDPIVLKTITVKAFNFEPIVILLTVLNKLFYVCNVH